MEYEDKSLKSQLKRADKTKSPYVAILGTEELNRDRILIRNLNTQNQEEIPIPQFLNYFLEKYAEAQGEWRKVSGADIKVEV